MLFHNKEQRGCSVFWLPSNNWQADLPTYHSHANLSYVFPHLEGNQIWRVGVSSSRFLGGTFNNNGIVFQEVESWQFGREHFHCLFLFKYQRYDRQEPLGEYPKVVCLEGWTICMYIYMIIWFVDMLGEIRLLYGQCSPAIGWKSWVLGYRDKFQHTLGRGADALVKLPPSNWFIQWLLFIVW